MDDYFHAATALAKTVRDALDRKGSVKRSELVKVLEAFEDVERKAKR